MHTLSNHKPSKCLKSQTKECKGLCVRQVTYDARESRVPWQSTPSLGNRTSNPEETGVIRIGNTTPPLPCQLPHHGSLVNGNTPFTFWFQMHEFFVLEHSAIYIQYLYFILEDGIHPCRELLLTWDFSCTFNRTFHCCVRPVASGWRSM